MIQQQANAQRLSWLRAHTQSLHGLFLQTTVHVDACAKLKTPHMQ